MKQKITLMLPQELIEKMRKYANDNYLKISAAYQKILEKALKNDE